jgi:hypothetical protein
MRIALGLILLFSVAFPFNASSLLVIQEGYARLWIILITDGIVVAAKGASGVEEEEVFALRTADKAVMWRFKAKHAWQPGLADGTNAFYMFDKDVLQKRTLQTGALLWSTRLDSIQEQKSKVESTEPWWEDFLDKAGVKAATKPVTVRFRGLGGTPNSYSYKPVLSGSTLTLFRDAKHSTGCIVTGCFSDWLTFDRKTGRRTSGGSGELLGDTEGLALFEEQSAIRSIKDSKVSEIPSLQGKGGFGAFRWRGLRTSNAQHSVNGRCIFEQTINGLDEICVFDSRNGGIFSFSAPALPDYQINWVLLDQHLLRYAECTRYAEGGRRPGHPWFELYDLKGQLVARTEMKDTKEFWQNFLGTTKSGKVLFRRNGTKIALEIPTLKNRSFSLQPAVAKSAEEGSYGSDYMVRGSDRIYVAHGNLSIGRMPEQERPHQLRISAFDAETQAKVWEHIEHVVVKRIQNSPSK